MEEATRTVAEDSPSSETGNAGLTASAEASLAGEAAEELRPQKPLSEREIRELRRVYFTVRHDTLKECGHKHDRIHEPKNNCERCWFVFFNTHGELIQTADKAFQENGKNFIESIRGRKFLKYFLRYMATIAQLRKVLQENEDARQANKVEAVGTGGEVSGEAVRGDEGTPEVGGEGRSEAAVDSHEPANA
jgi:hypothetical protein